jgi:hypothetical protein
MLLEQKVLVIFLKEENIMITINITVDQETKNFINKRFPKLVLKKCKSASFESEGFRGNMVETHDFLFVSYRLKQNLIEEMCDLVERYYEPVTNAVKTIMSLSNSIVKDALKLRDKYLTEIKK